MTHQALFQTRFVLSTALLFEVEILTSKYPNLEIGLNERVLDANKLGFNGNAHSFLRRVSKRLCLHLYPAQVENASMSFEW